MGSEPTDLGQLSPALYACPSAWTSAQNSACIRKTARVSSGSAMAPGSEGHDRLMALPLGPDPLDGIRCLHGGEGTQGGFPLPLDTKAKVCPSWVPTGLPS